MSKFLWVVLGVPLGIILVALGVANREPLTLSLDPFRPGNESLSIHPPLFLAFFVVLAVGVAFGGIAVWISHHKVRRALHRSRLETARLRDQLDKMIGDRAASATPGLPALGSPRRVA